MDYSFVTEWVEGKSHLITDALSRYPTEHNERAREQAHLIAPVLHSLDPNLEPLIQSTQDCASYQKLIHTVKETPPAVFKKIATTHQLSAYISFFEDISLHKNSKILLFQ